MFDEKNIKYKGFHQIIMHYYLTSQKTNFNEKKYIHKHSFTCLLSQFGRYPKCLWLSNLPVLYTNSTTSTTACQTNIKQANSIRKLATASQTKQT
jgi:hypothetical protein